MTTIDTSGRPAFMYDEDTETWYAISGRVSTSANYVWTGAQQFTNNVRIDGALTATLRFNSFLNPAARTAAIATPNVGLLTFLQQDAGGNTINRFEFWNGSSWTPVVDADVVTLNGIQTLTNKTLTSPTINTATLSGPTISSPVISGSASATADFDISGNIDMTGRLDVQELRETITDLSIVSNILTVDFTTTNIAYVATAPAANFTVNITNVPTQNAKTITVSVFVVQGATGRIPSALQIDGVGQTIKWASSTTPTPTSSAGKIDIFNFTLVRRSDTWTVFGNMNANF
jgi:hypothetical protein